MWSSLQAQINKPKTKVLSMINNKQHKRNCNSLIDMITGIKRNPTKKMKVQSTNQQMQKLESAKQLQLI